MSAPKKKSKGKRHNATAASFEHISKKLSEYLTNDNASVNGYQVLEFVVFAFQDEVRRLRSILR
jgi:hypothetical protein